MSLSIAAVTIDCRDAAALAEFWSAAFDVPVDSAPPGSSEFFASIGRDAPTPGTPTLMFIQVPEPKTVKNRAHLDLMADDAAAEVARLVELGATVVHEKAEWGHRWTTLTDPEGSEFCVSGV